MSVNEKFGPIRKGLLEFLILKIIAADKVYVADMLKKLAETEFATQEGTLYPLLSRMRREGLLQYEWQESDAGPPRKYYELTAQGRAELDELNDYWKEINKTIQQLGKIVMRKVLTISLNGNAYQIEEGGYDALQAYLESAQARLHDDPDRAEILADLEQAIAEKCNRFLGPHKSVVSAEEMQQVLTEMGPVNGQPPLPALPGGAPGSRAMRTSGPPAGASIQRPPGGSIRSAKAR